MAHSNTVFAQLLKRVPRHQFETLAAAHHVGRRFRKTSRWSQFVALAMGQLSGRHSAGSDLDICVLGEVSLLDVVKALSSIQESLRREINPVVMTTKKFSNLCKKKDRFVSRVLSEPMLFVKANEDELAKLIEDRATRKA